MNFIQKKLNEPFPDRSTFQQSIFGNFGVGVFITSFLFFFRPFGMSQYPDILLPVSIAFGGLTFVVGTLFDIVTYKILKLKTDVPSWKFKNWLISVVILISLITLANSLLVIFISEMTFNWNSFWQILISTWTIALFPTIFYGLMTQIRANKYNQNQAAEITTNLPNTNLPSTSAITVFSQNLKNKIELEINHLLFVDTMDNYVNIHYVDNQQVKKEILRNTLSNIEAQLEDTSIIRCHRSYMVNTALIEKVEGNAQGLKLTLNYLDDTIVPVSRKFIPALKKIID